MAIHELKMVTSLVSKVNRAMKWISSLQDEQKEFIQNLGNISSYKELVYLFEKELLNKIEETSRQVAKIKRYKLENYFLGLLGETAVKKYINDYYMTDKGYDKNNYLTPINFDIYENGGDPGYDFLSLIFDNFGVQVKTTKLENAQGNFNNLKGLMHSFLLPPTAVAVIE